jgi:hypothetical protein
LVKWSSRPDAAIRRWVGGGIQRSTQTGGADRFPDITSPSGSLRSLRQSAESLTATDVAVGSTEFLIGFDDRVAQALVIALPVVMIEELGNGRSQGLLTKEDHPM